MKQSIALALVLSSGIPGILALSCAGAETNTKKALNAVEGRNITPQFACSFGGNNDPTYCLFMVEDAEGEEPRLLFQAIRIVKGASPPDLEPVATFQINLRRLEGGDDDFITTTVVTKEGSVWQSVAVTDLPCGVSFFAGWISNGDQDPPTVTGAAYYGRDCDNTGTGSSSGGVGDDSDVDSGSSSGVGRN